MRRSLADRRSFLVGSGSFAGATLLPAALICSSGAVAASKRAVRQLPRAAIDRFRKSFSGPLIARGDSGYDAARQVWNARYDLHPGLIVQCASADDVVRAVNFARDNSLLFAVRSGGHSLAGKSTCDEGLVIDLSRLKSLAIDGDRRTATAGAGVLLRDLDEATAKLGLAVTCGTEPSTGIAGLTLGGGLGWLMGKFGLCCDNLLSVDMVLADGRHVPVSDATDPELFWAVRGAGANFGVATRFVYELHPVPAYYGGVIQYPISALGPALRNYRAFVGDIPDEVGTAIGLGPGRDGAPIVSLAVGYCGGEAEGARVLRRLREFGPKLQDDIATIPYSEFQARGAIPANLRLSAMARSAFLAELSDPAIETIARWGALAPPFAGSFVIEYFHGKAARIPAGAMAFPHRQVRHNFSIHADWARPEDARRSQAWGSAFWTAMQPFVSRAVYSNYLGDEGRARAADSYGGNLERLRLLKARYDPRNLFALNQNIPPENVLGRS